MPQPIVLDEALRAKLNGLTETIEVREPDGKRVGFFVTEEEYMVFMYAWVNSQVNEEELEQASRQTGGRLMKDVIEELKRS